MFKLSDKSKARLSGVHPELARVVMLAIEYTPHDFMVSEGLRDQARQIDLVHSGASMTMNSKHLMQKDGFGHAVDLVACGDLDHDGDIDAQDTKLVWDEKIYTSIAAAMMQAAVELNVRIRWGGTFKKKDGRPFFDGPHHELVV